MSWASLYVSHDGTDDWPTYGANSGSGALRTLQYAWNVAAPGQRILVQADGPYVFDGVDQTPGASALLTLDTGGDPSAGTHQVFEGYSTTPGDGGIVEINGNGLAMRGINITARNIICRNLHVKNLADHADGRCFVLDSLYTGFDPAGCYNVILDNCKGSLAKHGCFIYPNAGSLLMVNCEWFDLVTNGFGDIGGGWGGLVVIMNTSSHGNGAHGFICQGDSHYYLLNCLSYGNTTSGLRISGTTGSSVFLKNCTLWGNTNYGFYQTSDRTMAHIIDSIIANTTAGPNIYYNDDTIRLQNVYLYNGFSADYWNPAKDDFEHEIFAVDPKLMDPANGDFRLRPDSPCLNAGWQTPGSGYTSIGAWQRKSLLGVR